ncbi:MAG: hypothetical protein CVT65_13950 [Actinobacteria bacterium HGW-Actinobacteria-5]|nr:MAG: hypothetical protein CVT65_13950 [Actinobacteria bacterium HGW-Actinobacteria-5]
MAERGQRPRCGDWSEGGQWLSEDPEERAAAARWCSGCPVLLECAQAALDLKVTFGVWGGVDYTRREYRPRQST